MRGPNLPAAYCQIRDCGAEAMFTALLGLGTSVEFSAPGTQVGDVIRVEFQVVDAEGNDLAVVQSVRAWLSDTAAGAVTADPPDGGTAASTGTILAEYTANVDMQVLTDATGLFVLDITESAVDTWYLNVMTPNGTVVTSAAITFA